MSTTLSRQKLFTTISVGETPAESWMESDIEAGFMAFRYTRNWSSLLSKTIQFPWEVTTIFCGSSPEAYSMRSVNASMSLLKITCRDAGLVERTMSFKPSLFTSTKQKSDIRFSKGIWFFNWKSPKPFPSQTWNSDGLVVFNTKSSVCSRTMDIAVSDSTLALTGNVLWSINLPFPAP